MIRARSCAAPDYIAQHGVPHAPADLANHAASAWRFMVQWEFQTRSGIQNIDIVPRVTTDNGETVLPAGAGGVGSLG